MKQLSIVLTLFVIVLSFQVCQAAGATNSGFDQALSEGRYLDADRLASRQLKEIMENPDFQSSDIAARYLQAASSAQIWARWNEAERLLAALERGLHKDATPESNVLWVKLHTQQIALFSEMANYKLADVAYAKARSKVAKHKLGDDPFFDSLLEAQIDSLLMQQREWEASLVLEERLKWLERFDADNQLAIGEVLTNLGELNQSMKRINESNRQFAQAKTLLESAYKKKERIASIQAMSNWAFTAYEYNQDRRGWDHCKLRSELIKALENKLGENSPLLVMPLIGAATYCEDELGYSRVSKMHDRALKIATNTWGETHPQVLQVLNAQGTFYASREFSESLNEKGRRILKSELEMHRRIYADAPLVILSADIFNISNGADSNLCTDVFSRSCKTQILESLTSLSRAWGDKHPALAAIRTYMAVRLGDSVSSDASDADKEAHVSFVTKQCEAAFTTALANYGSDNPQTAYIAKECGGLAWSHGKMKDVEGYLSHAANIFVKHFGELEQVSKETVKDLSDARKIIKLKCESKGRGCKFNSQFLLTRI